MNDESVPASPSAPAPAVPPVAGRHMASMALEQAAPDAAASGTATSGSEVSGPEVSRAGAAGIAIPGTTAPPDHDSTSLMPPPAGSGRLRRFGRYLVKLVVLAFACSILLTVIYRLVPVPVTPLMLIRLLDGEGMRKDWVSYDAISPQLARAVIAAEDSGFCQHNGFDWSAIEKAWNRNQHSPRIRGGSTISNQTAKNVFLWPDRTYIRKAVEYYFTGLIEFFWTKRRILEVYLNVVEWGHGVYGAEAAAQAHF